MKSRGEQVTKHYSLPNKTCPFSLSAASLHPTHPSKANLTAFMNLEGVYVGDRASDGGPAFVPRPDNLVSLKDVIGPNFTASFGDPERGWALFTGGYGSFRGGRLSLLKWVAWTSNWVTWVQVASGRRHAAGAPASTCCGVVQQFWPACHAALPPPPAPDRAFRTFVCATAWPGLRRLSRQLGCAAGCRRRVGHVPWLPASG